MSKYLYEKMAITNIRKNGKIYFPYLITTIGSMMFYYILTSLGSNPNMYNTTTHAEAFKGASTLCSILQAGSFAASIFTFIFLLYANSFVLKHQKKQLGLYRVLGMERRHIVRIISFEVLLIFSLGLISGLFLGILFDKLMMVLLFKIIGQTAPAGFAFNVYALLQTIVLTAIIAGIIFFKSLFSILFTKDIELLKSEKVGEKEPKNRPISTLLGFILLGVGYSIALKSTNAGTAINNFLPAALLVLVSTYELFTSGSVSILKLLKKNKKYYYSTRHFISVSGLLYRMKQNAAGLATICILSTAAIIVLSAGAALYANGERSLNEQFPRMIELVYDTNTKEQVNTLLKDALKTKEFHTENLLTCSYGCPMVMKTENGIEPISDNGFTGFDAIPDTYILTLEEYNRFHGTKETLNENEILLYSTNDFYTNDALTFLHTTYEIKGVADHRCLEYITNSTMSLFSKLLIVVPNEHVFNQFICEQTDAASITWTGFDSNNSSEEIIAFADYLSANVQTNNINLNVSVKQVEQEAFYSMYGGILFVGIALGILFIVSTVMIIYYKQISEGYEDRERFVIMQKVGLSKQEIKQAIHSQILLIFFLPLVTAIIHSAVALKIVASCLRMVITVHMPTFLASVAVTCVLFCFVYMVVYKITSREYYLIVNE